MKEHQNIKGEYSRCVCCGSKKVNICPYCFTEFLHELLKLEKASQKVIGEFLFLFNFDFEHNGYYQEGEDIGVFQECFKVGLFSVIYEAISKKQDKKSKKQNQEKGSCTLFWRS